MQPGLVPKECASCHQMGVELGYQLQFCPTCRLRLSRRPIPLWILVIGFVVLMAALVSAYFSVSSLQAGIAYERGQMTEKRGDYATATKEYQKVVERFPNSIPASARLLISSVRAGNLIVAIAEVKKIQGKKVSKSLGDEVNAALGELEAKLPPLRGEKPDANDPPEPNAGGQP